MGVVAVVAGVDVGVYLAGGDDVCQVSVAVGGLFGYVFVFSSGSGGEYWFVYFLVKLVGACADETETFQMQAIYGMFLSDLAYEPSFKEFIEKRTWTRKIIALPLFITGLLIASYPGENPEWAHWSNTLYKTAHYLFPPEVNIGKRYTALGIDLIIFAIYISPSTKSFLSNPLLLWLGKQSFAVYLVHGTLLRTVLCWMLYGITAQPWAPKFDEKGEFAEPPWIPIRGPWVVGIAIPVWIGIVYVCAAAWTKYVDSFCARVTQWLEGVMFMEDEKVEGLPLGAMPMTS